MVHCKQHSSKNAKQLKDNKLKVTMSRLSLLDVLEHAQKPLSVKEIREELVDTKIDKVTVYRSVETLKKLGLIKQIQLKERQAYFEISSGKHHHHLICKECGTISDIQGCKLTTSNQTLMATTGFAKILDHSLEFFGICNGCFNK